MISNLKKKKGITYTKDLNSILVDLSIKIILDKQLKTNNYQTAICSSIFNILPIYNFEEKVQIDDINYYTNWSMNISKFEEFNTYIETFINGNEITL